MYSLKSRFFWVFAGYVAIFILLYYSLLPHIVTLSQAVESIRAHFLAFIPQDKFYHLVAYFFLMGWFSQIYRKKNHWKPAFFLLLFGIGVEFLQRGVGGRQADVSDVLANLSGILFAWGLARTQFAYMLVLTERRFRILF